MQAISTASPTFERRLAAMPKMRREAREDARRQVQPFQPLYDVLPDGAWAGEACFIVAGGPSLRGFEFERLHGAGRVIAINKAFLSVPFADVLFFMDWSKFYLYLQRGEFGASVIEAWKGFEGTKAFLNLTGKKPGPDVYSIRKSGRQGWTGSLKRGLPHGNNSGVGALGLAILLGANPIYLMGYDGKFKGGRSHFHGGYRLRKGEHVYRSFVKDMTTFIRGVRRARGDRMPRIVNLNPDSGYRMFEFGDVEEVLT
jgi:hypothetical protein